MIWLQGGICFLFWVAYGVVQSRRSEAIRGWAIGVSRGSRVLIAAAFMVAAIAQMFTVLVLCLHVNGFGPTGMTGLTWLGVALCGLLFVHGQTKATALLVVAAQESVTMARLDSSRNQTVLEIDQHEAPFP